MPVELLSYNKEEFFKHQVWPYNYTEFGTLDLIIRWENQYDNNSVDLNIEIYGSCELTCSSAFEMFSEVFVDIAKIK